jgi:hypothetical protein
VAAVFATRIAESAFLPRPSGAPETETGADAARAEYASAMAHLAAIAGSDQQPLTLAHDFARLADAVRTVKPRLLSQAIAGWVVFNAIGELACGGEQGRTSVAFDDWEGAAAMGQQARRSGSGDAQAWRAVELTRALLAIAPGALLKAADDEGLPLSWFESEAVRTAVGWNEWQGHAYVSQEAWDELVDAVAERDDLLHLPSALDTAAELRRRAALAGYRLESRRPDVEQHADHG